MIITNTKNNKNEVSIDLISEKMWTKKKPPSGIVRFTFGEATLGFPGFFLFLYVKLQAGINFMKLLRGSLFIEITLRFAHRIYVSWGCGLPLI
jgi:hypothetical protein